MVELARQALQGGTLPTVGGVRPRLGILLTPDALLGLNANKPLTAVETTGDPERPTVKPQVSPPRQRMDSSETCSRWMPPDIAPTRCPRKRGSADAARAALEQLGTPPPGIGGAASGLRRRGLACDLGSGQRPSAGGRPSQPDCANLIRKALHARDRGCRWPGCTAPAAWTEVHHLLAWYHGGLTNVDNCLLAVHMASRPGPRWTTRRPAMADPPGQTTGEVTVPGRAGNPTNSAPASRTGHHPHQTTSREVRTRACLRRLPAKPAGPA